MSEENLEKVFVNEIIELLKKGSKITEAQIITMVETRKLNQDKVVELMITNNLLSPKTESQDEQSYLTNLYFE